MNADNQDNVLSFGYGHRRKHEEIQAKTIKIGGFFSHPVSGTTLQRVEPRNFQFHILDAFKNQILAVDSTGGLYSIHEDNHVMPYSGVPLATNWCEDSYVVVVSFLRSYAEDLDILYDNFGRGKIAADPNKDFHLAAQQQLALELQDVYNSEQPPAGMFQVHEVIEKCTFDTKAMGWATDQAS